MKKSLNGLRIVLLAGLLTIPYAVANPAHAFLFFKHKKSTHTIDSVPESEQTPVTSAPVTLYPVNPSANPASKRLVPSYMVNSRVAKPATGNTAKKLPPKTTQPLVARPVFAPPITKNIVPTTPFIEERLDIPGSNQFSAISNIVPVDPSFTYTPTNIKIAIGLGLQNCQLTVADGAQLIDNSSGEVLANLPAQSEWILSEQDQQLSLRQDKDFYEALKQLARSYSLSGSTTVASYRPSASMPNAGSGQIRLSRSGAHELNLPTISNGYTIKAVVNQQGEQGLLALNGHLYRGDFLVRPSIAKGSNFVSGANFDVINCVDLEDYLMSVVPSEMPSLWPLESLKAQAIAARSYALANLGKHGSAGYDLKDNIEDQVYLGVKSESEGSNEAVNSTRGLVMRYNGKPICAYFHSCSGGSTERAENVWHSPVPYLKAVIDFDQEAPLYNWTKNYSILQTESGLPKDIGQVFSISILAKAPSGRATYILVNGSGGSRIISGEAARKYFNLPSSNFNVTADETAYIFAGKGFGHGLGLSQWGARALAKSGYNAAQILCYYYDGISIAY